MKDRATIKIVFLVRDFLQGQSLNSCKSEKFIMKDRATIEMFFLARDYLQGRSLWCVLFCKENATLLQDALKNC